MASRKIGLIEIGALSPRTLEKLSTLLKDINIEVVPLNLEELPLDINGVIFTLSDFYVMKKEELENIKEFLSKGNRIAFFFGLDVIKHLDSTLFELLSWLGITIRPEPVTDEREIVIKIFRDHIITRGLNVIKLEEPLSFLTSPRNLVIASTSFDEKIANVPVIVYGEKNRGAFLVIGSRKILLECDREKSIKRLVLNISCWLINDEECVKEIQKLEEESQIKISRETIREEIGSEVRKVPEEVKPEISLQVPKQGYEKELEEIKRLISQTQGGLGELLEKIRNIEKITSEVDTIKDNLNTVIELFNKIEKNQTKIIENLERLLSELSNLEIDLLEAMRDNIGAVSQLISKIDSLEKKLDKKIDKILEKLL